MSIKSILKFVSAVGLVVFFLFLIPPVVGFFYNEDVFVYTLSMTALFFINLSVFLLLKTVRGEKINAYYSILERIESSESFVQKKFCGGEGVVLLRKIDAMSSLLGAKPSLPDKVDIRGHFIVVRDNDIIDLNRIESYEKDDVLIAFTKESDFDVVSKWIQ